MFAVTLSRTWKQIKDKLRNNVDIPFACGSKAGAWYFVQGEACTQPRRTTWSNARCLHYDFRFESHRCS